MAIGWFRFRANDRNTGRVNLVGIQNPKLGWAFSPNGVGVISNVVAGSDGYMRFIGSDLKLYNVSPNGNSYVTGDPDPGPGSNSYTFNQYSAIVLDGSNNSYVTIPNGPIQRFNSNVEYVATSPLQVSDDQPTNGVVFLSNGNAVVFTNAGIRKSFVDLYNYLDLTQIGASLNMVSKGLTGTYYFTPMIPAIHNDYIAFVISSSTNLYATDGKLVVMQIAFPANLSGSVIKWQDTGYRVASTPAIDSNGYLYAIKDGNKLSRKLVMSSGVPVAGSGGNWDYTLDDMVEGLMAPSIDANNNVYIIDRSNNLYGLDQYGNLKFKVQLSELNGAVQFPVSIDGDNDLYIVQGSSVIKYDTTDHRLRWGFNVDGNITSSPVIVENANIYVPTDRGISVLEGAAAITIKGYNVYRSSSPVRGFEKINSTIIYPDTQYVDLSLADGTYYYMVKAVSLMDVESQDAQVIGPFIVNVVPPGKPKNLAFEASEGTIVLTWEAPFFNVDGTPLADLLGYDIYRTGVPSYAGSQAATGIQQAGTAERLIDFFAGFTATNKINKSIVIETSYVDTEVVPGYYYYYSVRARDVRGNSGPYADAIRAALNIYKMVLRDGKNSIGFPFNDPTLFGPEGFMTMTSFINKVGSTKVSKILSWNKTAQAYEQYPNFIAVDPKEGYIVIMDIGSEDLEVDVMGAKWDATRINFTDKLNLVNLPLKDYTQVSQLVAALGGKDNVKFVCKYNMETKKYEQYIPELEKGDFATLEAGHGYFVFLTQGLTNKQVSFSGTSWF